MSAKLRKQVQFYITVQLKICVYIYIQWKPKKITWLLWQECLENRQAKWPLDFKNYVYWIHSLTAHFMTVLGNCTLTINIVLKFITLPSTKAQHKVYNVSPTPKFWISSVCAAPHHWCRCWLRFVVIFGEKKVISLESCWQDKSHMYCFILFLLQFSSLVPAVFMLLAATVPSPNLRREIISWCCFEGEGYLSNYPGILVWKFCGFVDPCDYILNSAILSYFDTSHMQLLFAPLVVAFVSYLHKLLNCLPHSVMPRQCCKMLTYCSCLHCFSVLIFKLKLIVWWSTHLLFLDGTVLYFGS